MTPLRSLLPDGTVRSFDDDCFKGISSGAAGLFTGPLGQCPYAYRESTTALRSHPKITTFRTKPADRANILRSLSGMQLDSMNAVAA